MSASSSATLNRWAAGEAVSSVLQGIGPTADASARRQAALLAFGRRAHARPQLSVLVQDAVALVAETLEVDFSGVAQVAERDAGLNLQLFGVKAPPDAPPVATQQVPLGTSESLAAYVLLQAMPVATRDLAAESRFHDRFLRGQGIHGALAVPLFLGREPYGAIGVFTLAPREFAVADTAFAETIGHLLTSSIAQSHAEEALRRQQAFASSVLSAVESLVVVLDPRGRILDVNRAFAEVSGRTLADVQQKSFCDVFAAPAQLPIWQTALTGAARNRHETTLAADLTDRDGGIRQVAWQVRPLGDGHGAVQLLLVCGDDRTAPPPSGEAASLGAVDPAGAQVMAADSTSAAARPFARVDAPAANDKRNSPRRAFPYRQAMAPIRDGRLPRIDEFVPVTCEDISAGGIGVIVPQLPDYWEVVMALGTPPKTSFFRAAVVRVVRQKRGDVVRYLLGCQFVSRVEI